MTSRLSFLIFALSCRFFQRNKFGYANIIEIIESSKKINLNSPILKIRFVQSISINISSIKIELSPALIQGLDYEIVIPKYIVPTKYRYKQEKGEVKLHLNPGKSWLKEIKNGTFYTPLFVTNISFEHKINIRLSQQTRVATIALSGKACPNLPHFNGASGSLLKHINDSLQICDAIRIHPSKKLNRKQISSFSLLDLEPPLFIIDGSDQPLEAAAATVDSFLGAHSVLEVAWEPIYASDPGWWVLVPRPQGIPGHLFAILDAVQWRHPIVARADYYKTNKNCTTDQKGVQHCVPGCPGTKIERFIASGYNADTERIAKQLKKSMYLNFPFQAAPLTLGWRLTPPQWGGTIGWTYTFQGCASNFLDCFFLDHSPCPPIMEDIERVPSVKDRILPDLRIYSQVPRWLKDLIDDTDLHSDTITYPSNRVAVPQIMYSYLFRPKYAVRREVQTRLDRFNIEKDSCATLHVRRGDSVMHVDQGRAYITIDKYIAAARPLMDILSVKTVLLFTDSATAVEEALRCETEFPDVCGGIRFRYIDKKRWKGAEGGWENPFPTQNATEEFLIIQNEFSFAQKCSMAILGDSGYGDLLFSHMCCNFPLVPRGYLPTRCICPPKVDVGGNIHKRLDDPENMAGANYSFTRDAYRSNPEVEYFLGTRRQLNLPLSQLKSRQPELLSYLNSVQKYICKYFATFDRKFRFCRSI